MILDVHFTPIAGSRLFIHDFYTLYLKDIRPHNTRMRLNQNVWGKYHTQRGHE